MPNSLHMPRPGSCSPSTAGLLLTVKLEQEDPAVQSSSFNGSMHQLPSNIPACNPHSATTSLHADHSAGISQHSRAKQTVRRHATDPQFPGVSPVQAAAARPDSAGQLWQPDSASNAQSASAHPSQEPAHAQQQHKQSGGPPTGAAALMRVPISWGSQKPRTRTYSRLSDASTSDVATVAAAAAAEAEDAAASAGDKARVEFDEAASQSSTGAEPGGRSQHTRHGWHSQRPNWKAEPSKAAAHDRPRSPCWHLYDESSPDQMNRPPPKHSSVGAKRGARSGCNHRRAGASLGNLTKSMRYIGSTYLGVNGVRHSPVFPLRWRAGTWDPIAKKTVYIGSYNREFEAAAAVDAWHVSHGRQAVNFPETQNLAEAPEAAAEATLWAVAMADVDVPSSQEQHCGTNEEAEQPVSPLSPKNHLYHAASLLNSLRPQQCHGRDHYDAVLESNQHGISNKNDMRGLRFHSHYGHAGSKSQRQSAAGALVARAVGRSNISRDSMHMGRHSFASVQQCTGVSVANGEQRAQLGVHGVVHYVGGCQPKAANAQAHEQAAGQRCCSKASDVAG